MIKMKLSTIVILTMRCACFGGDTVLAPSCLAPNCVGTTLAPGTNTTGLAWNLMGV